MKVYAIKSFRRFQHYRDRKPPWVKLYRDLWRDRDFFRLDCHSKLLLIGLLTIASITENQIPDDPEWISSELALPQAEIDLKPLVSAGFLLLVHDASSALAECQQHAPKNIGSVSVSSSVSGSSSPARDPDQDLPTVAGSTRRAEPYPEDFESFWRLYPRKDGKREAAKAWAKLSSGDRRTAAADVPERIESNWAGRELDAVPHASTYLNQRRWEDPIQARARLPDTRVRSSPGMAHLKQRYREELEREQERGNQNPGTSQSRLVETTGR